MSGIAEEARQRDAADPAREPALLLVRLQVAQAKGYARSTTSSAVPRPGAETTRKPPPIDVARARMFFSP